ncbi:hypothetical protein YC2023_021631 [Brassica napus]
MATTETFRVKMKENNHEHMEKQNTTKEGSTGGKTTLTKAQVKCRPWKSQRWTKPKTYVLTFSNSNQQLPDEEKDPGGTSHFFHASLCVLASDSRQKSDTACYVYNSSNKTKYAHKEMHAYVNRNKLTVYQRYTTKRIICRFYNNQIFEVYKEIDL